jgi:histone-binding protein RBBP4
MTTAMEEAKVETPLTQYIDNEKLINEEFKIWKKTVPLLYDTIQTYALESPSLTVEALPGLEMSQDGNEMGVNFFLGTYNTTGENYLKLCSVKLPGTLSLGSTQPVPLPSGGELFPKFAVKQKWVHPGEVNKTRYSNGSIATFTKTGDIKIWTLSESEPLKTLKYHIKDGFGLEWSHDGKYLATGGEDAKVALWSMDKDTPERVYAQHSAIVNDFSWSYEIPTLFGSVSDDQTVKFFDVRSDHVLIDIPEAHADVINAIEFNPKLQNLFVTGGADNIINVWDLRNTKVPMRQLFGHNGTINQLSFNNDQPELLASSSNDRRIHIWDLSKLDEDFDHDDYIKNDKEDPCLKFIHGGHSSKVSEFKWVPGVNETLVSVGEDGLIEVWKPHFEEEDEDEDEVEDQKNNKDKEAQPHEPKDAEGDEKMAE